MNDPALAVAVAVLALCLAGLVGAWVTDPIVSDQQPPTARHEAAAPRPARHAAGHLPLAGTAPTDRLAVTGRPYIVGPPGTRGVRPSGLPVQRAVSCSLCGDGAHPVGRSGACAWCGAGAR